MVDRTPDMGRSRTPDMSDCITPYCGWCKEAAPPGRPCRGYDEYVRTHPRPPEPLVRREDWGAQLIALGVQRSPITSERRSRSVL